MQLLTLFQFFQPEGFNALKLYLCFTCQQEVVQVETVQMAEVLVPADEAVEDPLEVNTRIIFNTVCLKKKRLVLLTFFVFRMKKVFWPGGK